VITVLCGGVGAARYLRGLVQVVPPADIAAIVNVGDDSDIHGLRICPDLDTCTYTLADAINPETGWGLAGETWQARETLARYDESRTWFGLGDRDLGTHLYRTGRLAEGASLTEVTTAIARGWGIEIALLPVTDDRVETRVHLKGQVQDVGFQDYFVRLQHSVPIASVRFAGSSRSRPTAAVMAAIRDADRIVIAPSNPIVSIGPILAIPGVRSMLAARRSSIVAISPIVAGAALKGPADRMLVELGHEASVVGVARLYNEIANTLVIDEADAALAPQVEAAGMRCIVAPTIMSDPPKAAALAQVTLQA
jgi:LPPG:FO 2-phospho-L-lactate transferase